MLPVLAECAGALEGTEVTKEAAGMVLADDNFASITAAVTEALSGRSFGGRAKQPVTMRPLLSSWTATPVS